MFQNRRRLKSVFHAVKVVCAVSIKVKRTKGNQQSTSSEPQTISTFFCLDRVNSRGEKEGHHLFFDKWNFFKQNSVSVWSVNIELQDILFFTSNEFFFQHKLSLAARIAAAKPPKTRTEQDIALIQNVLNFLPHFKDKFSEDQKRKLGRAVWYLK
jgi:hypothetical protein